MDPINEILRTVERIDGRMDKMENLNERVSKLELWQAWLKGGWAALAAVAAYLYRITYGK